MAGFMISLRRWLGRLAMIAASSLATLVIAEGAARWLLSGRSSNSVSKPADLFVFDQELGYRLARELTGVEVAASKKNLSFSVTTRAVNGSVAGYRDELPDMPARPVHLAVGDSFTFCWTEAQDCWVEILEAVVDAEVVNLGVPGYGGVQQAQVLERDGLGLRPGMVLWGFFANDLYDNIRTLPAVEVHRWTWLEHKSLLLAAARGWLRSRASPAELVESKRLPGLSVRSAFYADSELRKWVKAPAIERGWYLQRQALLESVRMAEASGAQMIVVLMPLRESLYYEAYRSAANDLTPAELDRPYQLVRELCEREGIPVFDPTPLFEARLNEQFFHERDAHLNALGNRMIAEGLGVFLADGRYLEARPNG